MPGDVVTGGVKRWLFGKLPAHGDFVARDVEPAMRASLDDWLCGEMVQARAIWGDDFDRRYDLAPVWHFVHCDDAGGWSGGIMCTSADRVGRKFPLLIAAPASDAAGAAAMSAGCLEIAATAFAIGWNADQLHAEPVEPGTLAWQPDRAGWALVGDDGPLVQCDGAYPAGVINTMMEMVGMSSSFRIEENAQTHVGNVRSQNEDSHFTDMDAGVWVVADGMGGHANGKLASEALVSAMGAVRLPDTLDGACNVVSQAIQSANTAIFGHAQEAGVQMGSTVVAMVIRDSEFAILWAGDSRAYVYRDGQLIQLTRDHTQVQEMVDRGLLEASEAEDHPMKHVLSRAVGVQEALEIDAIRDELVAGDLFLLCSDGLYGVVGEAQIAQIIAEHGITAAQALIEASLALGAPDNVTVTLVGVNEPTLLVLNGEPS